ncbi:MAG: YheU family protein [Pseudomonadaceae bacterium]|nr:MAG: YheU family protein [Pseudomonadaceae bacterium]
MLIPFEMLEADTLQRLLEDFASRDGTDNGHADELATRVNQLRRQMERRQIVIVFHPDTAETSLAARHDVPKEWLQALDATGEN